MVEMTQHRWKRWGLLALLGLCLSWLISCTAGIPSASDSSESEGQTLEFWTMQLQPEFTDYFNRLIEEFEAENPGITVDWVDVPWADMQSKILTSVSANTAPDVVNLNPDFASQLAGRNAWLPLDDRIESSVKDQYLSKIWQASTIDGQSFGIPWYLATSVTISNSDLLTQAGIESPPTTYEELADVARTFKDETGQYAFFATVVPDDSAQVLQSFVQMGVQLLDDEGNAAFNSPEGRAAFDYWVTLYQDELLPREVLTQGHRRAVELYQAGETAILSTGPQFLSMIETNAPNIAEVSLSTSQITGETGAKNVAVMNLVIPRSTDLPEAAVDFALFVTNNENQLAFAKAANVLPSTVAALDDEYFTTLAGDASPADRARQVSAEQMQDAEVLLPTIADIKDLQNIIYDNLQAAMLNEKTIDEAIADAEADWNQR